MARGKKTGGRKAGTPNKLTVSAKEAFEFAFNEIGGAEELARWAKGNPDSFYRLYARLIPNQLTGADGKDLLPSDHPAVVMDATRRIVYLLKKADKALMGQQGGTRKPDA